MARPTLTAIVAANEQSPFVILDNLANQTVSPSQVLVGVSRYPLPWVVPPFPFAFTVVEFPYQPDFGYGKRNALLALAEGDYVGFFNSDDSYDGDYIEKMLDAAETMRADAVYCDWDGPGSVPRCEFQPCSSTLGNFIVRRSLLEQIGGFPHYAPYNNEGFRDARLIEEIRRQGERVAKIGISLYHHNVPYHASIRATQWGEHLKED